jgi:hypothetical protein
MASGLQVFDISLLLNYLPLFSVDNHARPDRPSVQRTEEEADD